jgi:hypothetical protein
MSEIPEDIRKAAWSVLLEMDFKETSQGKLDEVAKAIWSERQECAKIAEDAARDGFTADQISQAILNQTEE